MLSGASMSDSAPSLAGRLRGLVEHDEARAQLVAGEVERDHRAVRRATPFGRAAGIQDPDAVVPGHLRQMRVAVDNDDAAGKRLHETVLAPVAPSGVVHHT